MNDDEIMIKKDEYRQLTEAKTFFQQFKDAGYNTVADVRSEIDSWKATLEKVKSNLTAAQDEATGFKNSFQELRAGVAKALGVPQEVDQINAALGKLEEQLDGYDTLQKNFAALQSEHDTMTTTTNAKIAAYEALLKNAYTPAELAKLAPAVRAEIAWRMVRSLIADIKISLPKLKRR